MNFPTDSFPLAQHDVESVSLDLHAIDLVEFEFIRSAVVDLDGEARAGGNRLEQGAAAAGRIEVEVEIVDVSDLAGLIGDGRFVAEAFPGGHNLCAPAGIADLDAKG